MKDYLEWCDPRTGTAWLVRIFVGSSHDSTGQARPAPRMLTFRRPVDPTKPLEEIHSALIEAGDQLSLGTLDDSLLMGFLNAAMGRGTVRAVLSHGPGSSNTARWVVSEGQSETSVA